MLRSLRSLFGFCLLAAVAAPALAQPSFELALSDARRVEDSESGPQFEVDCLLVTHGLRPGEPGAEAWSLSIGAENCRIVGVTTDGTAAAPGSYYRFAEVTCGPGNDGAVSRCVLGTRIQPVTLDPGGSPHVVLKLRLEGGRPTEGTEGAGARLFYVDGRRSSRGTMVNAVTYGEKTLKPGLGESSFEVFPEPLDPHSGAPLSLIIQHSPVAAPPHHTEEIDFNAASEIVVRVLEGERGSTHVYAAIVTQFTFSVVQGWSLSGALQGDLQVVSATGAGTASASIPEGLNDAGFEQTEVVDPLLLHPDTGLPQGEGFVSAVVLGFRRGRFLPARGTATVLDIGVAVKRPQGRDAIEGRILWQDNMICRGCVPVTNNATVNGGSMEFCDRRGAAIQFKLGAPSPFIRCDATGDGRLDISDAARILGALFRGREPPACPDAADCTHDRRVDISDGIFVLTYLFRGASRPGSPFPDCGVDPDSTLESCPPDTTACPDP